MDSNNPSIACTLSATDFKNRSKWLNELTSEALVSYQVKGLTARLTYKADAAIEVEQLVRQEQGCCSFLRFELTRGSDLVELTITAPQDAGKEAHALFAHLIPG
jgi:hypothetical protein